MIYDDETTADAMEAWSEARYDVDQEMADMDAVGDAIARVRRTGRCLHLSAVGYNPKPHRPEQEGLKPGELRCTEGCGRVFTSDDDWYVGMDDAVEGA